MLVATLRDNDRLCPSRNSDMRRFLVVFAVVFGDLVNGRLERGFLLLETCWAQRRYGLLLVVGIDDLNDVDFSLVVDLPQPQNIACEAASLQVVRRSPVSWSPVNNAVPMISS